ncbi:MAG: nuclear transport factor 2 family protein [Alphaproteobacteria bacterium]|nr:nuclear transport factor 2 family protein [Alphaproteobacteria bacterium]
MKTAMIALAALLALGQPVVANSNDERGISTAITAIAAGADRHDWNRVRGAFTETVTTDYTSLWGGDPITQSSDELVAGWSKFLPGFDTTHHMVTNHTITEIGTDTALAEADFTATHRIDEDFWVLGGRYTYQLQKLDGIWKISSLTMLSTWETGDRGLVNKAAARAPND